MKKEIIVSLINGKRVRFLKVERVPRKLKNRFVWEKTFTLEGQRLVKSGYSTLIDDAGRKIQKSTSR